jgi:hypothetical protein
MKTLDRVSINCLRGEVPPEDLRRLWGGNRKKPWDRFVPFELVQRTDDEFFAGYTEVEGVSAGVAAAYRRMFTHIAFVGRREAGELVGYWLGTENRQVSDSPIVELNTEGQFHISGRNLAEYLLACASSDHDYGRLRSVLADLGLPVKAETQHKLLKSFDLLKRKFGNPNRISWRYQKRLEAPPPSRLRFGNYEFPAASTMLRKMGVANITTRSTRAQVTEILGAPTLTGGGEIRPLLGYIAPWIKYDRPDCQLRFEFSEDNTVRLVTMLEPDWEPGT